MTQKQIFAITANEEAMDILKEIAHIQGNMCFKTIYEQKTAKAEMKRLAKELLETIGG
nr:MAG TPA: hypothetical protein [Caudoviricetes sp.]